MVEDIVVIGAGGFGRETLDVIEAINTASSGAIWRIVGVADDAPAEIQLERIAARGYEYLGNMETALQRFTCATFTVGIGAPRARVKLATTFEDAGWKPATLVHPDAVVGTNSVIGEGSIVCGGVQLSTETTLCRYVHLNPGAVIGHDALLGEFVSVNPGAVVSGEVEICDRTLVGAGAVILQGLFVGSDTVIGASACVTRDLEPNVTVVGVPARQHLEASGT
ncbi:acetyltransferase [Glutamicibacter sp. BSL13]